MERRPNDSAVSVNYFSDNTSKDLQYASASQPPDEKAPAPFTEEQRLAQEQETMEAIGQASSQITVDNDFDLETDDGYSSDIAGSTTTSISSSVRDYEFENGRRYHKFREGSYHFPNDASEQDREDLKHAMIMNLLQKHHFAPIGDNPQEILDLGTGTGIWAIEMADQFPGATIRGIDLSPIQPEWVPPNVKFVVDDFESAWLYDENYFDYIHTRHTVMAVRNWDQLYSQAFKHLKPGAWIESQEIVHLPHCSDGSMPPNWPIIEYWNLITTALARGDVNFSAAPLLAQKMTAAGFINVTEQVLHVPIGPWARNRLLKLVGLYWRTVLFDGTSPIALRPLTRLGWTVQEVEVWLVQVRKAYMMEGIHAWMPLYLVQGQKPLNGIPASNWGSSATMNSNPYVPQQPIQQKQSYPPQQPVQQTQSYPPQTIYPPQQSASSNTPMNQTNPFSFPMQSHAQHQVQHQVQYQPQFEAQPQFQHQLSRPSFQTQPQRPQQPQPIFTPPSLQQSPTQSFFQFNANPSQPSQPQPPQQPFSPPQSTYPAQAQDQDQEMNSPISKNFEVPSPSNPRKHERQEQDEEGDEFIS